MLRTASLAPWVGLWLAVGLAWGQSPPGQFEREFQRDPVPRPPPEPIVPPGAEEHAPAGAAEVRFVLAAVQVDGVTVYSAAEIRSSYADLLGTEITLARVYELAAAFTRKYRNDGYVLSQVVVPQQAIRAGAVRLQAIEGYVASIRIQGEVLGPRADLDAYTERIRASRPLRAADLERNLLLVNELAGLTARATLSPAAEPGASDLTIDVSQRRARGAIGLSNRGSKSLGPWRVDASGEAYALLARSTARACA